MSLPPGAISDTPTRILLLVICGHRTQRAICRALGKSQATVNHHAHTLRDAGLVSWDDRKQGTLLPLVGLTERANHD